MEGMVSKVHPPPPPAPPSTPSFHIVTQYPGMETSPSPRRRFRGGLAFSFHLFAARRRTEVVSSCRKVPPRPTINDGLPSAKWLRPSSEQVTNTNHEQKWSEKQFLHRRRERERRSEFHRRRPLLPILLICSCRNNCIIPLL